MYNEIVSEEYQSELIYLRDQITLNSFRIGDIALEVIRQNKTYGIMECYAAVGMFIGKSSRTIREYTAVSAMYPQDIRAEFEVLAFDHFRAAMRLGSKWYEALTWATVGNRPASVDAMLAKFSDATVENFEEVIQESQLLNLTRRLHSIAAISPELPKELIDKLVAVLDEIEMALAKLAKSATMTMG